MFFKKKDQLLSWDSNEIDTCWVDLKSLPDKMKDEDYAIEYYTEGWPKYSDEIIGFWYPNSLMPSTKDTYFSNEKKYEYCIN